MKSKRGYQCVGDCTNKFGIVHPINWRQASTYNEELKTTENKCPLNDIMFYDFKKRIAEKELNTYHYDGCEEITNLANETDTIFSFSSLHSETFLRKIYDVKTFDDVINNYENDPNKNIYKYERILYASMDIWQKEVNILEPCIFNIITRIAKELWICDIFDKIKSYIFMDKDNNIYLKKVQMSEEDKNIKEKKIYIMNKFITNNNISHILSKYDSYYSDKSNDHDINGLELIKDYLIDYIYNKVLKTLKIDK